ncbi:MAG: DivIVA domain-containing protein [Candidatus Zixiibacteriota bacterium]|nr:MAG: DivIVA domain-containing protein [candidate division Zixibacteria bacterium]
MKITPLDIKKQEFGKKLNGYRPDEVNSFLDMVADEMEDLLKKNLEFEEKVKSLEEKLSNYTRIEDVLQDTLLTTQKSAEETKSSAELKAKNIIDEANISANKIIAEGREELLKIQKEIEDLKNQKEIYLINFRSLLDTQRSLLEMVEKRNEEKRSYLRIKMKPDLSEEDLERVVNDFERQYDSKSKNSEDSGGELNRLKDQD